VFSIIYFQNPFTFTHCIGATLVFLGTLMFVDVLSRFAWYRNLEEKLFGKPEEKKKE
jgi:uncharacterized protein (DUF486 family)